MKMRATLGKLVAVGAFCAACGAVFAAVDAVWAVRAIGLKWMLPLPSLIIPFCIAMGIYAACGVAGSALGWAGWLCLRRPRLRGGLWGRMLTGPAAAFGVAGVLWAMAACEMSFNPNVPILQLCRQCGVWLARVLGAGLVAAGGSALLYEAARRYAAVRLGLAALVAAAALVTALFGLLPLEQDRPKDARPNVVLLTVDALRPDWLSCYGGAARTPHIDRLAREGVKFTHAYAAAPWTRPSCASFLLSVYPTVHGLGEVQPHPRTEGANIMPSGLTTLAEAFRAAGYATLGLVTNFQLDQCLGFARGFDDYLMYQSVAGRAGGLTLREAAVPARVAARRALELARLEQSPARYNMRDGILAETGVSLASSGVFVTGAALRWAARARTPFFLWVHYMEVHQYWHFELVGPVEHPGATGHARLMRLASATEVRGPSTYWPSQPIESIHMDGVIRDYRARYSRHVAFVDALVGCLMEELEAQGLAQNTIVAFTSDHGEEFGERGGTWHGWTQYEEMIRAPLIIRTPSCKHAGAVVAPACSLIDLPPTLLHLASAPKPLSFQGQSLMPMVLGKESDPRWVYAEYLASPKRERKALCYDNLKCITSDGVHQVELYDLRTDPGERDNVALQRPRRRWEMLDELSAWQDHQAALAELTRTGRQGRIIPHSEMSRMLRSFGYQD